MTALRVIIVDDDPVFRHGLAAALQQHDDIDVLTAVGDGEALLRGISGHDVDLAVIDVEMPSLDGIGAARALASSRPDVTVVMLTAFARDGFLEESLAAGARGFLTKDMPMDEVVARLHDAAAGAFVMGPRPTAMLAEFYRTHTLHHCEDRVLKSTVESLPPRLREVFDLMSRAMSDKQISRQLHVTHGTARGYSTQVLHRTGCPSRTDLVLRAASAGLTAPDGMD
ncbi:response regulator transcription factor [Actinomyces polynesiensis]|uniref:response regulator transcription factor n=1 Tax=Actinomyces polynesiensis TaxID=1325934 RepID=UPI0005BA1801|nr:response regulator transcription factor [Actinomyces polynesiensis]